MRRRGILIPLLLAGFQACQAQTQTVRPAAVAGSFYPADPRELAGMLDRLLAAARPPEIKDPVALVAPHAGYVYSGGVAAHAYALLKGRKIGRVVVISPSHLEAFPFSAVYGGAAYATPLGKVAVDSEFASALAKGGRLIRISGRGHTPAGGRAEHALEVHLPFLQRVLGEFKLVPVVMGLQSYEAARALGLALAGNMGGPGTVIIASSDLSHYHPYDEAVKMDRKTLAAIEEWDYLSLLRNTEARVWEACGAGPIAAAMMASERLGARRARLLAYANSGDTSGDRRQVVGYGAMAIYRGGGQDAAAGKPPAAGPAGSGELLAVASRSVEPMVRGRRMLPDPGTRLPALLRERGAFVTLREHGQLRGCVGYPAPVKPLAVAVCDAAAYAACKDGRFAPVQPEELPLLEYEISVLRPLKRVLDADDIVVGRDGLVVQQGER